MKKATQYYQLAKDITMHVVHRKQLYSISKTFSSEILQNSELGHDIIITWRFPT